MAERTFVDARATITRGMQFLLFAAAMLWAAAASAVADRAADGIAVRYHLAWGLALLQSGFLLFLVVVGLRVLDRVAVRGRFAAETLPLPQRRTSFNEWATGAATGWGICLVAALPLLLSGNLHARLSGTTGGALAVLPALAGLLLRTLALEAIFRGYAFQRVAAAVGKPGGTLLLAVLWAFSCVGPDGLRHGAVAFLVSVLFGVLLAIAWLRTHGLWLGWGLHFAYRAVAAVVLGLPVVGVANPGWPAEMYTAGPRWLNGGARGLDGAVLTALVLLAGMLVLYRETRDWAWSYTHRPIVAAGYEVVVAPPAAHVAMEQAAASAPPPLVQILPSTPQGQSAAGSPHG